MKQKGQLQPGIETDVLVLERVMKATKADDISWLDDAGERYLVEFAPIIYVDGVIRFNPSTDIADMWRVVRKLKMQCGYSIVDGQPFAMYAGKTMTAKTVQLAVCQMALEAVGYLEGCAEVVR